MMSYTEKQLRKELLETSSNFFRSLMNAARQEMSEEFRNNRCGANKKAND